MTGVSATVSGTAERGCPCSSCTHVAPSPTARDGSVEVLALISVSPERPSGARGFVHSTAVQSNVWGGTRSNV